MNFQLDKKKSSSVYKYIEVVFTSIIIEVTFQLHYRLRSSSIYKKKWGCLLFTQKLRASSILKIIEVVFHNQKDWGHLQFKLKNIWGHLPFTKKWWGRLPFLTKLLWYQPKRQFWYSARWLAGCSETVILRRTQPS